MLPSPFFHHQYYPLSHGGSDNDLVAKVIPIRSFLHAQSCSANLEIALLRQPASSAGKDCILTDHSPAEGTLEFCTKGVGGDFVILGAAHLVSLLFQALVLHAFDGGGHGLDLGEARVGRVDSALGRVASDLWLLGLVVVCSCVDHSVVGLLDGRGGSEGRVEGGCTGVGGKVGSSVGCERRLVGTSASAMGLYGVRVSS